MVRDSPGSGSAGTTGSGRGAKPRVGWSGHRSCRLDAGERDERRGGFECEARSAAAAAVVVVLKWVGEALVADDDEAGRRSWETARW